ncbi:MAG: ABC transporter ATP-binding protein [Candidatus Poribacteria bacterium]|nr:MAG: ABC transporter ATP-binding protein [Candidatus Poribacteria bacterium]
MKSPWTGRWSSPRSSRAAFLRKRRPWSLFERPANAWAASPSAGIGDGGQPPIWAESISVRFGAFFALREVHFALSPGEITGILGPNGAGKTTLLRVLAGVLKPDRGRVWLFGAPLDRYSRRQLARRIGVIPQHSALDLELSVREIVAMGRFCHRPIYAGPTPEDFEAIERAIERMNLRSLVDRPAYSLSGGERQRMFLAQVLAQDPQIVLLDEPITHLDIRYQAEALGMLRELVAGNGWTAAVILHDLNLAYQFCDRLFFLRGGQTVAVGTVAELSRPEIIRQTFEVEAEFLHFPDTNAPYVRLKFPKLSESRPS